MRLHLIRHGQTNWNHERRAQGQCESELTETGRSQARVLRPVIDRLNVGAIYCSTSVRTRQTLQLMAGHLPLSPIYDDALREIRLGPWEERLWDEIIETDPEHADHFRYAPHQFQLPGAETFHELQQRGVTAIERIIETAPADDVLVVSHGGLIKTVLVHYAGLELASLWRDPELHNCAHSIIEIEAEGRPRITQIAGIPAAGLDWF